MKKTGLNGYVCEFNIDYKPFEPSKSMDKIIAYIHRSFMVKYNIK